MVPKIFESDQYSAKMSTPSTPESILIIPITSDRGLCGGINSNLLREMKNEVEKDRSKFEIMCIGDKGT